MSNSPRITLTISLKDNTRTAILELNYTGEGNQGDWKIRTGDFTAFAKQPGGTFKGKYINPDNTLYFHTEGDALPDFEIFKGPANPWDKTTLAGSLKVRKPGDASLVAPLDGFWQF